jgi:hypothetical protein
MKPYLAGLLGVCILVVVTGYAIATLGNHAGNERVYSFDNARAMLTSAPELWVGRTFYVHARLDGCPPAPAPCPLWQPRIFDPTRATARGALPVERIPPDSWLVALHRVPVLGAFVPAFIHAPRPAPWGTVATYQVQVRALPLTHCLTGTCDWSLDDDAFTCDARACYTLIVLKDAP